MQALKHSKWRRCRRLAGLLAPVILAGCAVQPAAPPEAVRVVSVEAAPVLPGPELIRALAATRTALADYPVPDARHRAWKRELVQLEGALAQGERSLTLRRARALREEVEAGTQAYFRLHAGRYLSQARQYAMLDSGQYDRLRSAEFSWHRAEYGAAYRQARGLVRELFSAVRWLEVAAGDSLISLSARPDVYDNGLLWPLLWRANKGLVRRPTALTIGWRLRLPVHPQLDEIFAAARFARERTALSGAARRAADEDYLRSRWAPLPL